jgi:O-antigen/teichoic acid export membrane protein
MAPLRARAARARESLRGATATTFLTTLVILGAATLAGALTARALGPAGRGQLTIVALWSGLIHTVGSLGLHLSCSYYTARWPDRRAALAGWFKRVAGRQAAAMTAVSAAVLWWLHTHLGLGTLLTIEYMTWAATATVALYGVMYAQGTFEFARFNGMRLISGAIPGALILVGTLTLRLTPAEAGAAYLIPTWCSAVLAGIWLHRASHAAHDTPLAPRELRRVWSYGWRSLGNLSGLLLNNSADQYTLGFIGSASSLGLYSAGASAAAPIPSLIASLGMVGLPTVIALTGQARVRATWRTLRRAAWLLAVLAVPSAALLPWAIPWAYGARYAAAVRPAELLLLGACFAALTTVVDALLRAYGLPGFVSITQGAGGVLTITGTLLVGGHPLAAVALVSSVGFAVSFALALARLWAATRRPRRKLTAAIGRRTPVRAGDTPYQPAHARPSSTTISWRHGGP